MLHHQEDLHALTAQEMSDSARWEVTVEVVMSGGSSQSWPFKDNLPFEQLGKNPFSKT